VLQPGKQRRSSTTRKRPDHAGLEGLAEDEILQTEEERARKERMSGNLVNCTQLATPTSDGGPADWQSLRELIQS
jgi:hypothetical protein